jgi:PKD repeat protein
MQYLWDFDDGSQSANLVAIHAFEQAGTYLVTLMVDSSGIPGLYSNFMYDWAYVTIHVTTEDTTLTVNADGGNLGGYETIVNEPIQLNGDAFGGNGDYTWHWNFGDQTGDSTLQNPIHTYTEPGTYTARLTVISDGETATDTAQVTVYDIDELFVTINDANTIAGIETMFAASIKGGTPPYTVSWDFGDGSTSQENRPTHIYSSPGEYTVTVTVTDNKQKTDQDTAKITVEEGNIIEEAEIKEVNAGLGIKAVIDAGGNNCNWEITVEGKVFLGGENSGTIDANTQETVKLGFSIAIGEVNIIVKAAGIQKEYTAFALGPLYLNLHEV